MHLQVASHAQKYFIRLNSQNKKDKRRASIHDITTVAPTAGDSSGAAAAPSFMSVPITGANPAVAAVVAPTAPQPAPAAIGMGAAAAMAVPTVPGVPPTGLTMPRLPTV
jgi:hypothetical protein